jgi:hypothetical protein
MSRLNTQCGILNVSHPYRPLLPVTGITLLLFERIQKETIVACLRELSQYLK